MSIVKLSFGRDNFAYQKTQRQKKQKLVEIKRTVSHSLDGTGIQKSFYGKTKGEAVARYNEYMADQKEGRLILRDNIFAQWAETWLNTYKKGKVKGNTFVGTYYDIVHQHLIPYFGKSHLTDIKPIHVQQFFDEKGKKYAMETVKKMRTSLRAIFDTAIENDLCVKNPVSKNLKLTSSVTTPKKRTYTPEQYDVVISYAREHLSNGGLAVMTLLKTGISRSELLGLKWENIDFNDGVIYIEQGTVDIRNPDTGKWETVSEGLKTDYRRRPVPIDNELIEALKTLPRTFLVGGNKKKKIPPVCVRPAFVFCNSEGNAMSPNNWMNRVYKPFMEAMSEVHPEIPALNPHEMRHTRATLWQEAGLDPYTIAHLLGHGNLDMSSKKYVHTRVEALKEALGYKSDVTSGGAKNSGND